MKKIIIASLFVFVGVCAKSQQTVNYTQYMLNNFAFNPAVAGSKKCINMRVGYRAQWVGFEGNPNTAFATVHSEIVKRGVRNNTARHGLGLRLINDETGPTSRTSINMAYAVHVKLSSRYVLSTGLYAGMMQYRLDGNELYVGDYADEAIGQSQSVIVAPDLTLGFWLYSNRDYVGLSIGQLVESKVPDVGTETNLTRFYTLTAGRKYGNLYGFNYIPSFKVEYLYNVPLNVDMSFVFDYNNKLGAGVNYRVGDAVSLLARASVFKYFTFGYSYDIVTSKINYAAAQTHEIMLGITACPKDGYSRAIECPTYF